MAGDLDTLVDMGFDRERAELAVSQTGGLQGAIDWLDKNQDKSMDEIKEDDKSSLEVGAPPLKEGEQARSLVCNECGKKFRSHAQAEFHASKTEHADFSESTEEIAPLTEEEKAAKLEELRLRLAEKRAGQSEVEKAERKRNEQIRMKSTKEQQDAKEDLAKKEQIKEAQAKRKEKQNEVEAKKRIKAKIEADKEERRIKAEREKAQRAGQPLPMPAETAAPAKPAAPKTAAEYTSARLRLQTDAGTMQKTFSVDTTLFEVAHTISTENGVQPSSFSTTFPKKTFDKSDFGMTLKEAGMVPSAALIVK